jgi:hypothetical protein
MYTIVTAFLNKNKARRLTLPHSSDVFYAQDLISELLACIIPVFNIYISFIYLREWGVKP